MNRNAIVGGLVFVALAVWCLKFPAPLGPPVETVTADYLPRPGAQFLWLYQSLKYVPGGLGSIAGLVLPSIGLAVLLLLPVLNPKRLVGFAVLAVFTVSIVAMTIAAYVGDRRDPRTREQLARQTAAEAAWRSEPFTAKPLQSAQTSASGGPPLRYVQFCANCHGAHGEGAQQGTLRFPPLLGVGAKPRRTVDDIAALLKDPAAYGLQPPMRSFSGKLMDQEMKEIAAWVVQLKK